jgi:heme/copper-type cytochrome/quinol oxidase subunit 2
MGAEHMSASDGFVLAMLAMIFLSASVIALLIFCGLRNAARRNRQVDDLLEEVAEEARRKKPAPTRTDPPKSEPWEKDGDWWKK